MRVARQVTRCTIALSTGLMLILGHSVASGSDSRWNEGLDPAASQDALRDAATSDTPLGDVAEDVAFQEHVNSVLDPLIERHEGVYASSGFTDDGRAWITFVGDVPREVEIALSGETQISARGGAVMSEAQADASNAAIFAQIATSLPESSTAISTIEPTAGTVTITVGEESSAAPANAAAGRALRAAQRGVSTPSSINTRSAVPRPVKVTIHVDTTMRAHATAINGGDKLTARNTTSLVCTAAFPAKSGSLAGLATARHCPDGLTADSGDRLYDASKFLAHSSGDVQWHRTKTTVNPRFRYDWGSFRPVKAHPILKVGTKACRFGAKTGTGSGCQTVKYVSSCVKYQDYHSEICGIAMTNGSSGAIKGDSGGPWYYGSNFYGVQSGAGSRDGRAAEWYTSSRKAISSMGLTAMLGN